MERFPELSSRLIPELTSRTADKCLRRLLAVLDKRNADIGQVYGKVYTRPELPDYGEAVDAINTVEKTSRKVKDESLHLQNEYSIQLMMDASAAFEEKLVDLSAECTVQVSRGKRVMHMLMSPR